MSRLRSSPRALRWIAGPAFALAAAATACGPLRPASPPAEPPAEAIHTDPDGKRYVVRTLEKQLARRRDADHAVTTWGHELALEGEDAERWHYRYYLPAAPAAAPALTPSAVPETPPLAEVATPRAHTLDFQPFGRGLPARGQWRDGFDLTDVDGDGQLDLVHGPPRKGPRTAQVFLGDGRGSWRPWREARFPNVALDYGDARAGDLDGDGAVDLVFAAHLRGLAALRRVGPATFTRAGEGLDFAAEGPAPFSSRAIRLLDFDRDGRLDVLALGEGPRLAPGTARSPIAEGARGVVLYRGLGDGRFERRDQGTGAREVFGAALALGDFDGDGHTDFATASSQLDRRDLVHLATGDGLWRAVPVPALRPRSYVSGVAAADFDGDGRDELAVAYRTLVGGHWWSGADVLLRDSKGGWRRLALAAEEGRLGPRALATGDLDGDGAADLVALTGAGAIAAFRGDGHGGFRRETGVPAPFGPGCAGAHVAIADLDADGRGDVVASFAAERAPGQDAALCPGEGGLAAWRSAPAR